MSTNRSLACPVDGIVVVDKPAGMTSHDVVARMRRWAGTRKVGHAGTLDPAATGVLVVGIGKATRLLGHLALHTKTYESVFALGVATSTDDAEGEVIQRLPVPELSGDPVTAQLAKAVASLTGDIEQTPPQVSAIKVAGQRAYARARAGEQVELSSRKVHIAQLVVHQVCPAPEGTVHLNVLVECSSGTYIRSLARDLGQALGSCGHVAALRRTSVGPYRAEQAMPLPERDELAPWLSEPQTEMPETEMPDAFFPMGQVARTNFPFIVLTDADHIRRIGHGMPVPVEDVTVEGVPAEGVTVEGVTAEGVTEHITQGDSPQVAVLDLDDHLLALAEVTATTAHPRIVFTA